MTKFIYGAIAGFKAADWFDRACLLLFALSSGVAIGLATALLI